MTSSLQNSTNPLADLPSVLAIRDLRRRLRRVATERTAGDQRLVEILQLDPLAAVRGLRATNAPVFGPPQEGCTVRGIVQQLGPTLSRRLLDTPAVSVAGTTPIRRLWLHSVATAIASRELANQSGLMDPEAAYLLGLLHDLPMWLSLLGRHQSGLPAAGDLQDWIQHWHLPADLSVVLNRCATAPRTSPTGTAIADPTTLVVAAELLAELADFRHPGTPEDDVTVLAAAEKADLVAAQRLRRQVDSSLGGLALDPTLPDLDEEVHQASIDGEASLFSGRTQGRVDEVVLNLLSCGRSESYRGIVTALTAAAIRYGGYDRAFYVKWNSTTNHITLRTKADSSARRLAATGVCPTPDEVAALRRALVDERPVRLEAEVGRGRGLLALLSVDELLAVPVNREFVTPSFLLLDRSLSTAPIQPLQDASVALTLGMTGSLLKENLLLRRRRQRSQKFALTDPLTRLFNRRMGITSLEQEIARVGRSQHPLTVLMCDLDHFKQLNDLHGHLMGDLALRATADTLRQTLRRSDTICRYGGEEFLVVLPETTPDDATVLAARLFTAIESRGTELGLPMTVSIGLTCHRPGDTAETMLQRADHALYASKGFGRNRFSTDLEAPEDAVPAAPSKS